MVLRKISDKGAKLGENRKRIFFGGGLIYKNNMI